MQGYEFAKQRVGLYKKEDAELWELVSSVPRLNGVWPYFCGILNVIIPGTGTMISSCIGYEGAWSKTQLTIGII